MSEVIEFLEEMFKHLPMCILCCIIVHKLERLIKNRK